MRKHIAFPVCILAAIASLLLFAGCTSAPKPVSHEAPIKQPRWEYTYLDGVGSDRSPEADKLRQAGWTFVGYNFERWDTIAIDENSEVARRMSYGAAPQAILRATFRREYR
jgi:hypothetical protein